jgi:hypothetical protein
LKESRIKNRVVSDRGRYKELQGREYRRRNGRKAGERVEGTGREEGTRRGKRRRRRRQKEWRRQKKRETVKT